MAANLLKMEEVPTITLRGLSEAQKKAYMIADNKIALNAGWDEDMLKIELEELIGLFPSVDFIGFEDKELIDLGLMDNDPPNNLEDDSYETFDDIAKKTKTTTCPKCGHVWEG